MHDKNKAWQSNSLAPWQLANLPSNFKGLRYVYCEGKSYLENATEDTEFFLNRPDEPRLYMAPLVPIRQWRKRSKPTQNPLIWATMTTTLLPSAP